MLYLWCFILYDVLFLYDVLSLFCSLLFCSPSSGALIFKSPCILLHLFVYRLPVLIFWLALVAGFAILIAFARLVFSFVLYFIWIVVNRLNFLRGARPCAREEPAVCGGEHFDTWDDDRHTPFPHECSDETLIRTKHDTVRSDKVLFLIEKWVIEF